MKIRPTYVSQLYVLHMTSKKNKADALVSLFGARNVAHSAAHVAAHVLRQGMDITITLGPS